MEPAVSSDDSMLVSSYGVGDQGKCGFAEVDARMCIKGGTPEAAPTMIEVET